MFVQPIAAIMLLMQIEPGALDEINTNVPLCFTHELKYSQQKMTHRLLKGKTHGLPSALRRTLTC